MSTAINPGRWEPVSDESSFKPSIKSIVITVSLVALAALAAGGALWYFGIDKIAAWATMGGGGLLITGAAITYVVARLKTKSYNVLTWNVGKQSDYGNMFERAKMQSEGKSIKESIEGAFVNWTNPSKDQLQKRNELIKGTLDHSYDIICLQEADEFSEEKLIEILPEGFLFYQAERSGMKGNIVAWDSTKFAVKAVGVLTNPEFMPNSPDTLVQLQDKLYGTTVCVASSHLHGFNLNTQNGKSGDDQARYASTTLLAEPAYLYLFAGDFNATTDVYTPRAKVLTDSGFSTQFSKPTIYDTNLKEKDGTPKAIQLDFVYAKGGTITSSETIGDVKVFKDRPSDHLPVQATIAV